MCKNANKPPTKNDLLDAALDNVIEKMKREMAREGWLMSCSSWSQTAARVAAVAHIIIMIIIIGVIIIIRVWCWWWAETEGWFDLLIRQRSVAHVAGNIYMQHTCVFWGCWWMPMQCCCCCCCWGFASAKCLFDSDSDCDYDSDYVRHFSSWAWQALSNATWLPLEFALQRQHKLRAALCAARQLQLLTSSRQAPSKTRCASGVLLVNKNPTINKLMSKLILKLKLISRIIAYLNEY